jgi:hypothetical protein
MTQQPVVGQGLLIVDVSKSHSDTPHSVWLLWTGDQPDAETSTWQHTTLTRDKTSTPAVEFEPKTLTSERMQAHALDRVATGIEHAEGTMDTNEAVFNSVLRNVTP